MLSRLAVLMAKAQVFTAVHNLTGLEITLTHITPANQAHFLGHKLSLKLARDFNHPDDSRAWLKVSPISRYIPADKLDKIQAHMKDFVTWTHLSHPNILPLYGLYIHSGPDKLERTSLIFPWITTWNLRDHLQLSPNIPRLPLVGL